jgi:uncharacterized membrane protein
MRPYKLSWLEFPLGFILALAAFLRFYNVGWNSLWLDEAVTWTLSKGSPWDIFLYMTRGEYNPPLFYWVEHVAIPFLGTSEVALRAAPAIFGALTVVPAYYLGRRIGGEITGALASFMLSVSVFAIYYSQEARGYTLFMLLMVSGTLLYLEGLETGWVSHWAGAVLCFAGAVWTNFYALVFVAAILICTPLILGKGRELRASWRYWVVFTGLIIPILGFVGFLFLQRAVQEVANGLHGLEVVPYSFAALAGSAVPIAVIFFILLCWSLAFKPSREKWFLAAVILIPILVGVPVSLRITFLPRYVAPAAVLIFVLVADAWRPFISNMVTGRNPHLPKVYAAAFLGLVSLNIFVLPIYYTTLQKDDWRGMVKFLDERTRPGDRIVSVPAYRLDWEMKYYYNNTTRGTVLLGAYNVSEVVNDCGGAQCYIIITRDNTGHYTSAEVQDWVDRNAVFLRDFQPQGRLEATFPQMKVYEL